MIKQRQAVHGVECAQHHRVLDEVPKPQRGQCDKPHQHHGPKDAPDTLGAVFLKPKKQGQNHARDGYDVLFKRGINGLKPFCRPQDGNGRRNDAVAVKEGRAN